MVVRRGVREVLSVEDDIEEVGTSFARHHVVGVEPQFGTVHSTDGALGRHFAPTL